MPGPRGIQELSVLPVLLCKPNTALKIKAIHFFLKVTQHCFANADIRQSESACPVLFFFLGHASRPGGS